MDFGEMIRDARLRSMLSQAELAERSATSQATLSAYERGRKVPSAATLARVLAATGHRLTTKAATRAVLAPTGAAHERVARTLIQVLDLATALPSRPEPDLRYPRLPTGAARQP